MHTEYRSCFRHQLFWLFNGGNRHNVAFTFSKTTFKQYKLYLSFLYTNLKCHWKRTFSYFANTKDKNKFGCVLDIGEILEDEASWTSQEIYYMLCFLSIKAYFK